MASSIQALVFPGAAPQPQHNFIRRHRTPIQSGKRQNHRTIKRANALSAGFDSFTELRCFRATANNGPHRESVATATLKDDPTAPCSSFL
jgi:hypothetical protein